MASAGPSEKHAATRLPELAGWVGEIAELTKPDAVVWCDGSQAEWDRRTTLLVEISDTGSGIPENLLATIFNPFVTTKAHGTGLGLAICRSITDAHHAVLSARNNVGRPGTTFTIQFPVPVRVTRMSP